MHDNHLLPHWKTPGRYPIHGVWHSSRSTLSLSSAVVKLPPCGRGILEMGHDRMYKLIASSCKLRTKVAYLGVFQ